jgi:hypothetical protein
MQKPRRRRRGPSKDAASRKDRLIQTRVPRGLESALKEEAERRRLSVSHLIRNVLEDTFELVDHVVAEVDNLVSDSVGLAQRVRSDAQRIAASARGEGGTRRQARAAASGSADEPAADARPAAADPLSQIYAWNQVVLNRAARCARCRRTLAKGSAAHLGLTQAPSAAPTWLCEACIAEL